MDIPQLGGVGGHTPPANTPPAQGSAHSGSASLNVSQTSVSSSSTSTSYAALMDGSGRATNNLALAYLILSMLLNGTSEEDQDRFLQGLAAGLLAGAESQRGARFMFAGSRTTHAETATTLTAGAADVNAAYNTELPQLAADASSSAETAAMKVPKIDTQA